MSGSGVSTVFCHAELHPETYEMSTIAWSLISTSAQKCMWEKVQVPGVF